MIFLPPIVALVLSFVVTRVLVSLAPRVGLVDVPNERSLHVDPVATVGGVGVLAGVGGATGLVYLLPLTDRANAFGLCLAAALLLVLIRDERRAMRWQTKLVLQTGASVLLVWWTSSGPATLSLLAFSVSVVFLTYTQNVYNFMDGLDGLSGLVGCVAGAVLCVVFARASPALSLLCLSVSAASLGFVVWNVPPARIFMGDVGSHFLGLFFGWLALTGASYGIPTHVALLPIGAFLFDATYTILRRAFRRENVTRAHRFHLYQRLARSGWTSFQVDCVYVVWTGIFGAAALALHSDRLPRAMVAIAVVFSIAITVYVEARWAGTGEDR